MFFTLDFLYSLSLTLLHLYPLPLPYASVFTPSFLNPWNPLHHSPAHVLTFLQFLANVPTLSLNILYAHFLIPKPWYPLPISPTSVPKLVFLHCSFGNYFPEYKYCVMNQSMHHCHDNLIICQPCHSERKWNDLRILAYPIKKKTLWNLKKLLVIYNTISIFSLSSKLHLYTWYTNYKQAARLVHTWQCARH